MRRLLGLLMLAALLPAAVSVDGPATARGIVASPFACAVLASGGSPLVYSAASLPDGLAINAATGVISGTPTAAATSSVLVSATGSAGSGSATLTITITADGATGHPDNAISLAVSAGSACSFRFTASATGGSFIASGLPTGLTLDGDGLLHGTPTTAGVANLDLSCDGGTTGTSAVIRILAAQAGAPVVSIQVQPVAAAGAGFGYAIDAPGADAFACSSLPAWLQLDASAGTLSGTPASSDVAGNLLLTASAGSASATTVLAIPVAIPDSADPLPVAPALAEATVGSGLGWKATATLPAQLSAVGLPAGLSLGASSGLLSGAPTAAGIANLLLTATPSGSGAPVTTTCAIRVASATSGAPTVAGLLPPVLTAGAPAAFAIATSGGADRFSVSGDADFSIDAAGLVSGTPAAAGTPVLRIVAGNAAGSTVTTLMLQVGARVTDAPLPTMTATYRTTVGSAFAAALSADATVASWTADGLPGLIELSPFSGILTGSALAAGASTIAASPDDADGSNPTAIVISAAAATTGAPVIAAAGPWRVGAGQPLRLQLQADLAATWTVSGLPTGLTATTAGAISGQVDTAGNHALVLGASAGAASAVTSGLLLVETTPTGAPVFSDPGVLTATVGTAFHATLAASSSPIAFTLTDGPSWMALDGATGALSGTPDAAGTAVLSVTASNAAGTARTLMVLTTATAGSGTGTPTTTTPSSGVGGVSGGGCGAGTGAAGLLAIGLLAGLRRRRSAQA